MVGWMDKKAGGSRERRKEETGYGRRKGSRKIYIISKATCSGESEPACTGL